MYTFLRYQNCITFHRKVSLSLWNGDCSWLIFQKHTLQSDTPLFLHYLSFCCCRHITSEGCRNNIPSVCKNLKPSQDRWQCYGVQIIVLMRTASWGESGVRTVAKTERDRKHTGREGKKGRRIVCLRHWLPPQLEHQYPELETVNN